MMNTYVETEKVCMPTAQSFRYLRSTIDRVGGANKDVERKNRQIRGRDGYIWLDWDLVPTNKMKSLIYKTVVWRAMCVRLLEHRRDSRTSKYGTYCYGHDRDKVVIARAREKKTWNRKHHSSCRNEDGVKRPRWWHRLKWKDTVRRNVKVEKMVEELVTDIEKWKGIRKTHYPV